MSSYFWNEKVLAEGPFSAPGTDTSMKWDKILTLIGVLLLLPGVVQGGISFHPFFQESDEKRGYWIYLPDRYQGSNLLPVVLVLHGEGMDGESMIRLCNLNEKADQAGFLVVYPNGTGQKDKKLTWNAGRCCGSAQLKKREDVAFIKNVLNDVEEHYPVDRSRVYATGISNGAMMAYRLAAEIPYRIAAVAAVGGSLEVGSSSIKWPVPVLHFHGTHDESVHFDDGHGPQSQTRISITSAMDTIRTWVWVNRANKEPETTEMPDQVDDGTKVVRYIYRAPKTRADVILYKIQGGGHTWPGRPSGEISLGPSTQQISANDLIWEFFKKYKLEN
jgi:polyhydroxybutyrate depolymerase